MPKQTVFVGLSGGVDSSVAALRLKRLGYQVVGVFIKVWQPNWLNCNWEEERLDAMRVAAHLEIPFLTCNAEDTYKRSVADYFIAEYQAGRTPNPDVLCNKEVKFGSFLKFAIEKGADYVATGHYARKGEHQGKSHLLRGHDQEKDQSYFLWTLTQAQLKHILLPIGDSVKSLVRTEALDAKLPVANKSDSQGICFLGHIDIKEFLSHYTTLESGLVVDESGDVVGTHDGALLYTIGQRHGFTLTSKDPKRKALFVTEKNLKQNTISVGERPLKLSQSENLTLSQLNWIADIPSTGSKYEAQFRYRQKPFEVEVKSISNDTCTIQPQRETEKVAAGQSCVLYQGDQCIGGGMIAG